MLSQQNDLMENFNYLFGASGHCKVIIDVLKSNNIIVNAIFDDKPKLNTLIDIPVHETSKIAILPHGKMIVSIGDNKIRKKVVSKIKVSFFTAIHVNTIISENSKIGEGTVIMAGCIVNSDTKIGKHCIINTGAIIEHDCKISDYVHVSPGVSLAGNITIGEGSHLGIGACVIQGIKIGKWVTIGAGTVIINDVPDYSVVVGNPGKIIKYNIINE